MFNKGEVGKCERFFWFVNCEIQFLSNTLLGYQQWAVICEVYWLYV